MRICDVMIHDQEETVMWCHDTWSCGWDTQRWSCKDVWWRCVGQCLYDQPENHAKMCDEDVLSSVYMIMTRIMQGCVKKRRRRRGRRRRRRRKRRRVATKKQEPHTEMWGTTATTKKEQQRQQTTIPLQPPHLLQHPLLLSHTTEHSEPQIAWRTGGPQLQPHGFGKEKHRWWTSID